MWPLALSNNFLLYHIIVCKKIDLQLKAAYLSTAFLSINCSCWLVLASAGSIRVDQAPFHRYYSLDEEDHSDFSGRQYYR